jgi:hypothetical protein
MNSKFILLLSQHKKLLRFRCPGLEPARVMVSDCKDPHA